jgi:NitT/TauT family transport system substrate-binding protein
MRTTRTALALMLAVALAQGAAAETKVRIGFTGLSDIVPVFAAKEEGFFARRGIDAELLLLNNGAVITAGLAAGSIDLGTLAPPVFLQAVDGGIELVALTGLGVLTHDMKAAGVVARTGSGIKNAEDFVGKRVAISGIGSISQVLFREWLAQRRIAAQKVIFVEVPYANMPDVLKSGNVDAVIIPEPQLSRIVNAGTGYVASYYFGEAAEGTVAMLTAARRDWAEKNPAAVKGIQEAIAEAGDFVRANPGKARDTIGKYLKLPPAMVQDTELPSLEPALTAAKLQWWLDVMDGQGMLRTKIAAAPLLMN